jgi:hypothetical protein
MSELVDERTRYVNTNKTDLILTCDMSTDLACFIFLKKICHKRSDFYDIFAIV